MKRYILNREVLLTNLRKVNERLVDSNDMYVDWGDTLIGAITHTIIGKIRSAADTKAIELVADELDRFMAELAINRSESAPVNVQPKVNAEDIQGPFSKEIQERILGLPEQIEGKPTRDIMATIMLKQTEYKLALVEQKVEQMASKEDVQKELDGLVEYNNTLISLGYNEEVTSSISEVIDEVVQTYIEGGAKQETEEEDISIADVINSTPPEVEEQDEEQDEEQNDYTIPTTYQSIDIDKVLSKYSPIFMKVTSDICYVIYIGGKFLFTKKVGDKFTYREAGVTKSIPSTTNGLKVWLLKQNDRQVSDTVKYLMDEKIFEQVNYIKEFITSNKRVSFSKGISKRIAQIDNRVMSILESSFKIDNTPFGDTKNNINELTNGVIKPVLDYIDKFLTNGVSNESLFILENEIESIFEKSDEKAAGYSDEAQDIDDEDLRFMYRFIPKEHRDKISKETLPLFIKIKNEHILKHAVNILDAEITSKIKFFTNSKDLNDTLRKCIIKIPYKSEVNQFLVNFVPRSNMDGMVNEKTRELVNKIFREYNPQEALKLCVSSIRPKIGKGINDTDGLNNAISDVIRNMNPSKQNKKKVLFNRIKQWIKKDVELYGISDKELRDLNEHIKSKRTNENLDGDNAKRLARILAKAKNRMVGTKRFDELRKKQQRYFDKLPSSDRSINKGAYTRWVDRVEAILLYYKDIESIPDNVRQYIANSLEKEQIADDYVKITKEFLGLKQSIKEPESKDNTTSTATTGGAIKTPKTGGGPVSIVGIDSLPENKKVTEALVYLKFEDIEFIGTILERKPNGTIIKGNIGRSLASVLKVLESSSKAKISIQGDTMESFPNSSVYQLNNSLSGLEFSPNKVEDVYILNITSDKLVVGNDYTFNILNITKYTNKDIYVSDFRMNLTKMVDNLSDVLVSYNKKLTTIGIALNKNSGEATSIQMTPSLIKKTDTDLFYVSSSMLNTIKALSGKNHRTKTFGDFLTVYNVGAQLVAELSSKYGKAQSIISDAIFEYANDKKNTNKSYDAIKTWIINNKLKK